MIDKRLPRKVDGLDDEEDEIDIEVDDEFEDEIDSGPRGQFDWPPHKYDLQILGVPYDESEIEYVLALLFAEPEGSS